MDDNRFMDIKVGDTVLTQKTINYGWRSKLTFYVSTPVSRVTKAQFEVDGKMHWKKNGCPVAGSGWDRVCMIGETLNYGQEPMKDQTTEYTVAKKKFNLFRAISEKMTKFQKIDIHDLMAKDLDSLIKLNESIHEFVTEEKS